MLGVWRAADQIELFESAWNWDHLYPLRGDPHGSSLEAWVTLAALAQATQRIGVGCMVTGMHFRHPAIIARMSASLDLISSGRSYLGLGAGWFEAEALANGIELGTVGQRLDRFEEGVDVIVSLLTNETTHFEGEYYRLTGARCEPKPMQRPHPPIMIGGTGRKRTLRIVARHAQMWDLFARLRRSGRSCGKFSTDTVRKWAVIRARSHARSTSPGAETTTRPVSPTKRRPASPTGSTWWCSPWPTPTTPP
jgi:alkanesulfonate monooxygenase SsuD/methylene tetrahydromethanopterin reductase-like flavin-dependent oxidoreductase (luciferase family)